MAKNSVADLLNVDSLFTTQAERDEAKRETVMDIPLGSFLQRSSAFSPHLRG